MRNTKTLKNGLIAIIAVAVGLPGALHSQVLVTSSTVNWNSIVYGSPANPDPFTDQQTGDQEGDIVGTPSDPSLYSAFWNGGDDTSFTDGEIGFRLRIAENKAPGSENRTGPVLGASMFVGIDGDSDGILDIFLSAHNSGSTFTVAIYSAGASANNSPSTTSIGSTPYYEEAQDSNNYSWVAVSAGATGNDPSATTTDVDGGGENDFFISFKLPFQ